MSNNDWYQIGEEIKRQVQDAIDTNNFTELSKNIGETVGQALGDVGKGLNEVGKSINDIGKSLNSVVNDTTEGFKKGLQQGTQGQKQKWERYNGTLKSAKPNLRPDPKLFNNTPPGSVSGVLCILAGLGLAGIGGWATLSNAASVIFADASVSALALPATAATTGLAVSAYGASLKSRADRFKRYVGLVKEKLYCSIEELADKTGKSIRYVRKDLKKMMDKKMFLQGHLDKKGTCFIASDEMYDQYLLTQKQYEEQLLLESKEAIRPAKVTDSKVVKILQEGRDYIAVIRKCNDEIPGEEMSEKLDKMERLVTRIFDRVEEEPSLASDMQKLLNYYLPTTQKLLEAYRDLDKQNVEVKNISETKQEIEKSVDTINMACEGLLNDLFRDRAWDIQSDISVLTTMAKQDGYLKSDFNTVEKEN